MPGWHRCGPHQEHRIDAIQAFIQGLGKGEISAYHVNVWRQISRVRVACERADSHVRRRQLGENLAADPAGSSDDEDAIHARPCYRRHTGLRACPDFHAAARMSTIREVTTVRCFGWSNSKCIPRPIKRVFNIEPPQVEPWMWTSSGSGQNSG